MVEHGRFLPLSRLDDCANPVNQWLTVAGFLHICFQPYFTHLFSGAFMYVRLLSIDGNLSHRMNPKKLHQMTIIRRLCLVMGVYMFSRYLMHTPAHYVKAAVNTDW